MRRFRFRDGLRDWSDGRHGGRDRGLGHGRPCCGRFDEPRRFFDRRRRKRGGHARQRRQRRSRASGVYLEQRVRGRAHELLQLRAGSGLELYGHQSEIRQSVQPTLRCRGLRPMLNRYLRPERPDFLLRGHVSSRPLRSRRSGRDRRDSVQLSCRLRAALRHCLLPGMRYAARLFEREQAARACAVGVWHRALRVPGVCALVLGVLCRLHERAL
jgi:hypothetical protein